MKSYSQDPHSISEVEAYFVLKDLAWKEYRLGSYDKAIKYAKELLRINNRIEKNWNYGNAIHHGHTIIGLIKLENQDSKSARNHLVKSSKIMGSPQLDTFGPNFELAQKMIEIGEIDACKIFLNNCNKFWKMGKAKISNWQKEIEAGEIPTMYYKSK